MRFKIALLSNPMANKMDDESTSSSHVSGRPTRRAQFYVIVDLKTSTL